MRSMRAQDVAATLRTISPAVINGNRPVGSCQNFNAEVACAAGKEGASLAASDGLLDMRAWSRAGFSCQFVNPSALLRRRPTFNPPDSLVRTHRLGDLRPVRAQVIWISSWLHQRCTEILHPEFPMKNLVMPLCLVTVGIAIGAAGIYVGETDDAPGAALLGLVVMLAVVAYAVRTAWRKRSAASPH